MIFKILLTASVVCLCLLSYKRLTILYMLPGLKKFVVQGSNLVMLNHIMHLWNFSNLYKRSFFVQWNNTICYTSLHIECSSECNFSPLALHTALRAATMKPTYDLLIHSLIISQANNTIQGQLFISAMMPSKLYCLSAQKKQTNGNYFNSIRT